MYCGQCMGEVEGVVNNKGKVVCEFCGEELI